MSRVAGIVCAVSLALYGASCFIVPTTMPKGAPQRESGAVVGQPSAIGNAAESASWSPLAVGAALGLLIAVATGRPALAADLENGEAIFNGNCTACHAGGNNSIVAEKKLKKATSRATHARPYLANSPQTLAIFIPGRKPWSSTASMTFRPSSPRPVLA